MACTCHEVMSEVMRLNNSENSVTEIMLLP